MHLGSRNPVQRLRHLLSTHDPDAQPDATLLAQFARDRDEAAFTALVRRHTNLVLGTARRVLGNSADADDVFQAVFLTLSRKAGSVRCDGTLAPWLYRVALRAALRLRKRARPTEPVAGQGPAVTSDPLANMSARELCSAIDTEVNGLSARLRAVVVLCCFQGQTRDEAAAQLGWSSATVKRRLARARALLEQRLSARGIALPAALVPVLLATNAPVSAECVAATVETGLGRITPSPRVGAMCTSASASVKSWIVVAAAAGVVGTGIVLGLQPPRPAASPVAPTAAQKAEKSGTTAELSVDPLPAGAVARIGTTRFRHDEWVSQAEWSPDGKYIISAAGATLIVWDANSGRELARLTLSAPAKPRRGPVPQQIGYVRSLHWANDRRSIFAVINGIGRLCSWDAGTRELREGMGYVFEDSDALVMAMSADGSRRFAASTTVAGSTTVDRTGDILAWQAQIPFGAKITGAVVSPTEELAVIATDGGKAELQVFDLRWRQPVIARFDRTASRMAFSKDGKTFAAAIEDEGKGPIVELWDAAAWKSRLRITYPASSDKKVEIRALALSPDGKTLVTGASDKTLRWFDTATGKETRREGPGWVYYNRAAFRPDGKVLLTVSHENHIRLWNVETGKQLPHTEGPGWTIAATTFTPDGRTVLSVSENLVFAHDATTGRELWRGTGHTDTAVQVAVTPDGRTVISSGNDGRIIFRDAATGKAFRTIECPRHAVDRIAVSPDGRTLAALGGDAPDDAIVRRWDVATGKAYPDAPLPPKGPKYVASSIHYTSDGTSIYFASGTELQLPVFDPDRKEFRQTFGPTDGGVNCADMTADGRMVAAATAGGSIFLWEAATNHQRLMLKDVGYTTCLAFSPDGRILAVANDGSHRLISGDKEVPHTEGRLVVRLLDAFTGKEFHRFAGHTGSVYRLAWSADGLRLVSASNDASALIWDVSAAIWAKLPAGPLSGDAAAKAVGALSNADAAAVYREMARLAGDPASAVKGLRPMLRPVSTPDPTAVAGLLRDLDSPQFAVRERAASQLSKLGEGAEGSLRKALDTRLSAEARDRIEKVLADVSPPDLRLRQGRAIELLERIGDPAAQTLLKELAAGADGAWLTREAKAALDRLNPRSR